MATRTQRRLAKRVAVREADAIALALLRAIEEALPLLAQGSVEEAGLALDEAATEGRHWRRERDGQGEIPLDEEWNEPPRADTIEQAGTTPFPAGAPGRDPAHARGPGSVPSACPQCGVIAPRPHIPGCPNAVYEDL